MNSIDLIILSAVLLGAGYGLFRGAVRPIMGLIAIAAAFVLGHPLGMEIAPWLGETFQLSQFMAERIASYAAGFFIYLCVRFLGRFLEKWLVEKVAAFQVFNRAGGTLLGAMQVSAVLFAILIFFAFLPQQPIRGHLPKLWESEVYQAVKENNPFVSEKALKQLRGLRTVVSNPKRFKQLKESPQVQKLLKDYEVPKMLEDRETVDRIKKGDYKGLTQNEKIEGLAKDDQLEALIGRLETSELK